jgi:hypothetical protein
MANDDSASARGGLLPVDFPFGNFRRNYYRLTTSAAAAVFIGQPMDLDGNGCVTTALVSTANSFILGPVVGFAKYIAGKPALPDAMLDITAGPYLPANTDAYVLIADDPNQLFTIQEATGGTALTTANIGSQAHITYERVTSGNTTTGYSYCELNAITAGATNGTSGALTLVKLSDQMNSDGTANGLGDYAKWVVRVSNHRFGGQNIASSSV